MPRQARATPAAARVRPGNDARRNPQIASAPPPSAETQRSLPPTFCLLIIESSSWSRNHAGAVPPGQCSEAGAETGQQIPAGGMTEFDQTPSGLRGRARVAGGQREDEKI